MPTRTETIARSINKAVARASLDEVMSRLKSLGSERNRAGMQRYGINVDKAFGVSVTKLRALAKEIGRNHELSLQLWSTRIHEAWILAALVGEPEKVTPRQMDAWVRDFDSWDVCDTVCGSLFDKTPFAYKKAADWSQKDKEFVKRAGFALMAWLAVHDKKANNKSYEKFFLSIRRGATDERNFVKKAVNWALRQIGKRNRELNKKAITLSKEIQKINSKSARWVANDALKELTSSKVQARLDGARMK